MSGGDGLLDDDGLLGISAAKPPTPAATAGAKTASPQSPVPQLDANGRPLCPVCRARPARQRCNACGRDVCPADVWTMLGLCKDCASAQDVARWHKPAAPEGTNWLGGKP